jgi:hypothetical protein
MVIVIRALQAVLMLFALGGAVTAFVVGVIVIDGVDGCVLAPAEGDYTSKTCSHFEAKASSAIGVGASGVASAVIAIALNGLVPPKPQVQGSQRAMPPQQPTGPYPQQQPPFGPPR